MKLIEIPYSVELEEVEAKMLNNAEELLREILDKLPDKDTGEFSVTRKKVQAAFETLKDANCELCVHMLCDPNY